MVTALRACWLHEMQLGELEGDSADDAFLALATELRKRGGPEIIEARAIIFTSADGKCGEVFVIVPGALVEHISHEHRVYAVEVAFARALKNRVKLN